VSFTAVAPRAAALASALRSAPKNAIPRGSKLAGERAGRLLAAKMQELVPEWQGELKGKIGFRVDDMVTVVGVGSKSGATPPEYAFSMESGMVPGKWRPHGPGTKIARWAAAKFGDPAAAFAVARALYTRGWPPSSGSSSSPHAGKQPPIYVERAWDDAGKAVEDEYARLGKDVVAEIVNEYGRG